MKIKAVILDEKGIERSLMRMAHEIVEKNKTAQDLYLIGIQRRGVPLANRLADCIAKIEGERPPVGLLDITHYRDDLSLLSKQPILKDTKIDENLDNNRVILVDDVFYTGRTIRAAIDALFDRGRPLMIQLAILVDRGHREIPIRADYVGKNIPTAKQESIYVLLEEIDGENMVYLSEESEGEYVKE